MIAFIGLGSNVGDRAGHIGAAIERLRQVPGVRVLDVSQLRETAPVGGPPQGPFLNGAARIETSLAPHALLHVLKAIERERGREPSLPRNHPRPLDLDVLLYGDQRIDTRELRVPHPRLHEREFALVPLRELGVDTAQLASSPAPLVVEDPEEFAALNSRWLRGDCITGLVPTMGALHEGHASLLRAARLECDRVAATIFVNPLQFGQGEDYERYPRTLPQDLDWLRREGTDVVFVPSRTAMYAGDHCTTLSVGPEAEGMEGAVRPGHFKGVATVVAKLFALARPTIAYFGRKDAQQVAVIRRMTRDLGLPIDLRECPTVRDADGLALSSRNVYLSPADRAAAPVLYGALCAARDLHRRGERRAEQLRETALRLIAAEPRAQLDYLELRREGDLGALPKAPVASGRLLVAARFASGPSGTRLIDNISLAEPLSAAEV